MKTMTCRDLGGSCDQKLSAETWHELLGLVSRTYHDADQDRYTLERSIDISSRELQGLYHDLKRKSERKLEVPDAGQDSTYLSLAAFIDNARGKKKPLNNAESARISTLTAMLGRKSIYERRIVKWEEVDV